MQKEITKQGIKISHPSGVIQIIPEETLIQFITEDTKQKAMIQQQINERQADLSQLKVITESAVETLDEKVK